MVIIKVVQYFFPLKHAPQPHTSLLAGKTPFPSTPPSILLQLSNHFYTHTLARNKSAALAPSLELPAPVAVLLVHQEVEVVLLDVSGLCVKGKRREGKEGRRRKMSYQIGRIGGNKRGSQTCLPPT